MAKPLLLRKRAKVVALIVFFLGILIIGLVGNWWPGVMLVVGLPLAIWQYLQGRHFDTWVTLFVFIGAFVTVQFEINWQVFLPVLFAIGGLYILLRELLESKSTEEEEKEDQKKELEENEDKD